jgi:hypothetical protein
MGGACSTLGRHEHTQFLSEDLKGRIYLGDKSVYIWGQYEALSKSFRTESIRKYMLTFGITSCCPLQRVTAAKLTRLTHKIAIQLYLVAKSCIICSSRCRRPVRKLLDTPSYFTESERNRIGWCGLDSSRSRQGTEAVSLNTVMKFQAPWKVQNFLTIWATVSFFRRLFSMELVYGTRRFFVFTTIHHWILRWASYAMEQNSPLEANSNSVEKCLAFYGNQRSILVFTRACHWTLSWARWIQSTSHTPLL